MSDSTDRQEIAELVARLGWWLDDQQFDDATAILAPDVEVSTPGGQARGIEGVAAQARRNHERLVTQHVITGVTTDLDGDRASVRANLVVTLVPRAPTERQRTLGERYGFGAVRTADGWRLNRIEVTPVWTSA